MNLLETLFALLAGLACTAALALCAHDLRARTQALQEAGLLQAASRQAGAACQARAGELAARLDARLAASSGDPASAQAGALLALDPAELGIAPPPEGRSLRIALADPAAPAAGTAGGSAGGTGTRRFLRLFVWLEGADPALAARAALALPRGWHGDGQGGLVWPNAGGQSRTSLPGAAGQASPAGAASLQGLTAQSGQAWPSPGPGAFGTEVFVPLPASAAALAPLLAARRQASGAGSPVRRTWGSRDARPAEHGSAGSGGQGGQDGQAAAADAGATRPAVPSMRQPLDMQGHALAEAASLGFARLKAGGEGAGGQNGGLPDGQALDQTSGQAGEGTASRLQALAGAGLDAVEQACREGALEGVLARGADSFHICRQRRLLPLLAREDAPSVVGIVSFAAGETPPGEPAACPAGRTPAVFYTPAAAESRSLAAELALGTTRVFSAAFQGPVDQHFQWLAVQACL